MNNNFLRLFLSIVIKRKKVRYIKEIIIGILTAVLVGVVFYLNRTAGNLLIFTYCCITQITTVFGNDEFWSTKDFLALGIKPSDRGFPILYVCQRILSDTYISNSILYISISLYLWLLYGGGQLFVFWYFIIISYVVMPYNNVMSGKLSNQLRYFYAFLLVITPSICIFLSMNVSSVSAFFRMETKSSVLVLLLCGFIYFIIVYILSSQKGVRESNIVLDRRIFAWFKVIDIHLYKDVMLNYKSLSLSVLSMVSICILFFNDIVDGYPKALLMAFIICPSLFSNKKEKKYTILTSDNLFHEFILLKSDSKTVRLKKLKFLNLGGCIRFLIACIMLFILGLFDLPTMMVYMVSSFAVANLEYISIYRNKRSVSLLYYVSRYSMPIIYGCILYFDLPVTLAITYVCIVFVSYYYLAYSISNEILELPNTGGGEIN